MPRCVRNDRFLPDGVIYSMHHERMNVIDWLLDSDPAIRWQVMRDLTDAPADEVAAERARVAREGWGAQLLKAQDADPACSEGPSVAWAILRRWA